jgi:hypothetical protein
MRIDIPFAFLEAGDNVSLHHAINNQLARGKKENGVSALIFLNIKSHAILRGAVIAA